MAAPAATALGGPGQTRAAGTPAQPETRFDRLGWLAVHAIGTPVSVAAGTVMNVWRPGASRYGGAIGK